MTGQTWALATAREADGERAYLVRGEDAVALDDAARAAGRDASAAPSSSVLSLLQSWDASEPWLHELAALDAQRWSALARPLQEVQLAAPVTRPGTLLYAAANYRAHVMEQQRALHAEETQEIDKRTLQPYFFMKPATALSGPFDDIVIPDGVTQMDWEVELAFVIGRGGFRISESHAMEHIAGYLIADDITARDLVIRRDWPLLRTDWLAGKGFPGFAPLGPLLVPACFVPDPLNIRLQLRVNGESKQDANTADMVFTPAEQIAFVSSVMPLEPGDVISTGTPEGVGFSSGVFLQAGDVIEAGAEGLGWQRTTVVAAGEAGAGR